MKKNLTPAGLAVLEAMRDLDVLCRRSFSFPPIKPSFIRQGTTDMQLMMVGDFAWGRDCNRGADPDAARARYQARVLFLKVE